jgi:IclR family acetate operon transcriptional repressor
MSAGESAPGVQSIKRAFDLLEAIADNGGLVAVSTLATESGLPLPTVHRLLRTMVNLGFVQQLPSRQYALGPRLIRLGESAGKSLGASVEPFLVELAERTGETANLAILEGDVVVYVSQVPSRHAMRMFTEIGRRVLPHSTGVGKALLAQLRDEQVHEIVRRTGMPARTPSTITTYDALVADLELIRARGYAEDNAEQEIGVRCIAAAIPGVDVPSAVSISGPSARLTHDAVAEFAPVVRAAAASIGRALTGAAGVT